MQSPQSTCTRRAVCLGLCRTPTPPATRPGRTTKKRLSERSCSAACPLIESSTICPAAQSATSSDELCAGVRPGDAWRSLDPRGGGFSCPDPTLRVHLAMACWRLLGVFRQIFRIVVQTAAVRNRTSAFVSGGEGCANRTPSCPPVLSVPCLGGR